MPQHERSPENRLANLSLASPTSEIAQSTLGPPSWQRSPESERPSIPASTRTQYCLRNPLSLAAPHCRTVHRLKSFLPSTVTLFNSLPSSAVSCSSKSSFKHAIDLHFVEDKFSYGREVRTINDRNICGRRSWMKNNSKSPTFKFVSGEERRPSEVRRVSRCWRLPGATNSSAGLTWIRK